MAIHRLDPGVKSALEKDGELEVVLTLKTDGTIDFYHPDSIPMRKEQDLKGLNEKPIKNITQMTYYRMNSGCMYIDGDLYCWECP